MLLLAAPLAPVLPPSHQTLSYVGLLRSIATRPAVVPAALAGLADTAPPFDATGLHFVATDRTERLNVVLILLESFRSHSTTPYEPDLATTPFLDALARRALLVEDMYAVVPYTNKALIPTLAGIYPELTRAQRESARSGVPGRGLPALLEPHGYRTAFFTPATMSFERKDLILENLGFDEIRGDGSFPADGFAVTNYFGREDQIVIEPSLAWIDEARAAGEPFFLTYLTLTAHHGYTLPPDFPTQRFAPQDEALDAYLNTLRYTDAFLADLFAAFEARGLLDDTLFLLVGDHGEAFGEHGVKYHGDFVWDEVMRVPALVFCPSRFPEGGRIEGLRQQIDLLPTVADVLGFELAGGTVPGRSLLAPAEPGRTLYFSAWNSHVMMGLRRDSLKFVYHGRQRPMQVFDLEDDPFERTDLADTLAPEHLKAAELDLLLWRHAVQSKWEEPGGNREEGLRP